MQSATLGLPIRLIQVRIEILELDERRFVAEVDVVDGVAARLERLDEVGRKHGLSSRRSSLPRRIWTELFA